MAKNEVSTKLHELSRQDLSTILDFLKLRIQENKAIQPSQKPLIK